MTEKFIIQEDGLVKVDNKRLISFSEFEKIILEDIPTEKIEGFEVRYDHYCITYYDRSAWPCWIEIRFSNPNVIKNYKINFNINEGSRKFYITYLLLWGKNGRMDALNEKEKLICLNYFKENIPKFDYTICLNYFKENIPKFDYTILLKDIGFLLAFLVTIGGILFVIPSVIWLKFLIAFLVSSPFAFHKVGKFIELSNKRKVYQQKIEYLSKKLNLEKTDDDVISKEKNLDKERNFSDGVLEEIYVLLDEVSIVNVKDRDIVIDKIKLILKDYLTKLKELKENEASFGYDERCVYLKKETFKKIAMLKMEISILQKSSKQGKSLNNDIDMIEEKIESLSSDKKVRSRKKTK